MDDDRLLRVSAAPVASPRDDPAGADPAAVPQWAGPERAVSQLAGPEWAVSERAGPVVRSELRLRVVLAAAVVVVVALAGWLYLVLRPSDAERRATRAVAAYTDAWNAHDTGAVRAAMYPAGTFAATDNLTQRPLLTAVAGPDLDRVLTALFAAGVTLETTGPVLAVDGTSRVSVRQRFRYTVYGLPVAEDGISQFTLLPAGDRLVVEQHVWWRPRVPASPSMLWVVEQPGP